MNRKRKRKTNNMENLTTDQLIRLENYRWTLETERAKKREEQANEEIAERKRNENETFSISIQKNNKTGIETFQVEGIKNAEKIFESYRAIGHEMNIYCLILRRHEDGKRFKRINFTY